jgi:hypothetical protein
MIERKLADLIHESLEGNLTAPEQQQLTAELSRNPEADRYYRDWQIIRSRIEQTKNSLAEIQLAPEILKHLPMESQHLPKPEPIIRIPFWKRLSFRYSMVLIAGIFLGFMMFSFFAHGTRQKAGDESQMKGTLYDTRGFDQMKQADNILFDNNMIKGSFNVRYSTGIVEARITFSSLYPIKGLIEFDYNNFQVLNVSNVSVNDQSNIIASPNYIQINNVGDNQYIVQLLNKNSLQHQIGFKILQNDVPVYQNAVVVNKE